MYKFHLRFTQDIQSSHSMSWVRGRKKTLLLVAFDQYFSLYIVSTKFMNFLYTIY